MSPRAPDPQTPLPLTFEGPPNPGPKPERRKAVVVERKPEEREGAVAHPMRREGVALIRIAGKTHWTRKELGIVHDSCYLKRPLYRTRPHGNLFWEWHIFGWHTTSFFV